MTYYPVPDEFYTDPRFVGLPSEAVDLWIRAASFSCHHLTDGYVPEHMLKMLLQAPVMAPVTDLVICEEQRDEPEMKNLQTGLKNLQTRGIWRRDRTGGYQFVEWPKSASRAYVESNRAANRTRQARSRSSRTTSSRGDGSVSDDVSNGATNGASRTLPHAITTAINHAVANTASHNAQSFPVLPLSSRGGAGARTGARASARTREATPPENDQQKDQQQPRPAERCDRHTGSPSDAPCRACGEARQAATDWDKTSLLREVLPVRRCQFCDAEGWRFESDVRCPITPYVKCNHQPVQLVGAGRGEVASSG